MSTDSQDSTVRYPRSNRSLDPLDWVGIVLATVSGAIHFWLGVTAAKPPLALAGMGFAAGTLAVLLDVRREQLVRLGIPFVAVQILLYGVGHGFLTPTTPTYDPIEIVDKAVQIALIGVLVVLNRRA